MKKFSSIFSILTLLACICAFKSQAQVNQSANISLYSVTGCSTNYFPANGPMCITYALGNSGTEVYTPGTLWIQISWTNSGAEAVQPPANGAYGIFDTAQNGGRWRIIDTADIANGSITIANMNGTIGHSGTADFSINLDFTFFPVSTAPADTLMTTFSAYATVNPDSVAQAGNSQADDDNIWGNVAITPVNPLPVKLQYFIAEKQSEESALLQWSTATETDNKGFNIMRSADGREWSAIGWVGAAASNGHSSAASYYRYLDAAPLKGNNYYKLQQVDLNNHFEYSNVAHIFFRSGTKALKVYPNPLLHDRILTIDGLKGNEQLYLVSQLGQTVMELPAHTGKMQANLENLTSGLYYLRVVNGGKPETYTILLK
ncbi:MAG: T9SS type A sorting domain-containing protein [Taibaiella sp.]|nr:T9SS type A sorting domain-containing protein [Taibaiella sp.]